MLTIVLTVAWLSVAMMGIIAAGDYRLNQK